MPSRRLEICTYHLIRQNYQLGTSSGSVGLGVQFLAIHHERGIGIQTGEAPPPHSTCRLRPPGVIEASHHPRLRHGIIVLNEDIRLVGIWEPLPRLSEFSADFASQLGVSVTALLRRRDIFDLLDLAGAGNTSGTRDIGQPLPFDS